MNRTPKHKINKPEDCHGCVFYNAVYDKCNSRNKLICNYQSLEEVYKHDKKK